MKNIIIVGILAVCINAADINTLYTNYTGAGGKISKETKELLDKDEFYQNAVQLVSSPKKETISSKNPETMEIVKVDTVTTDWANVYLNLVKSNQKYKNPVSAFSGLNIINKYMGQVNKIDDYKAFSQTLYEKEKNMCDSFLNYAAIYEKGFGTKVDYVKAKEIYEEATKGACKEGWQDQVVQSKLWYLNRKIK